MKKCPKCGAELQENARFCLYCMTSLEEKEKIKTKTDKNYWWLYIIAAILVILLILVFVFSPLLNDKPNSPLYAFSNSSLYVSDDIALSSLTTNTSSLKDDSDVTTTTTSNNQNTFNSTSTGTSTSSTSSKQSTTTTSVKPANSTTQPTVTTPIPKLTYLYRDATYGDDFAVSTDFTNCVVITGIKTASLSGEYNIPSSIDGKKVIAIMGLAFSDSNISSTVKKVIVPSSVKTIWNYAFSNCYNLSDIYFCGNAIYTETKAFADKSSRNVTLTIHCSANCNDRNYRYYKNTASDYDAQYSEWNY